MAHFMGLFYLLQKAADFGSFFGALWAQPKTLQTLIYFAHMFAENGLLFINIDFYVWAFLFKLLFGKGKDNNLNISNSAIKLCAKNIKVSNLPQIVMMYIRPVSGGKKVNWFWKHSFYLVLKRMLLSIRN